MQKANLTPYQIASLTWRGNGALQKATQKGKVYVRKTKTPHKVFVFTPEEWKQFVEAVKHDDFFPEA